jgi:hypothetical protein
MLTQTHKIIGYQEITVDCIHLGQTWTTNKRTHAEFASLLKALPRTTTGLQIRGCRNPFLLFEKVSNGELPNLAYLDLSQNGDDFGLALAVQLPSIAVFVPNLTKLKIGGNTSAVTSTALLLLESLYEFIKERNDCQEIVPLTFIDISLFGIPPQHRLVLNICDLLMPDPYLQWFGDSYSWTPKNHPMFHTLESNQKRANKNLKIDQQLVSIFEGGWFPFPVLMILRGYCWTGAARVDTEAQALLYSQEKKKEETEVNETLAAAAAVFPRHHLSASAHSPPQPPSGKQPRSDVEKAQDFLEGQISELEQAALARNPKLKKGIVDTSSDYELALALAKEPANPVDLNWQYDKKNPSSKWCAYCLMPYHFDQPLWRCKACKNTYYCNETCQRADWNSHKLLCKEGKSSEQPYNRNRYVAVNPEKVGLGFWWKCVTCQKAFFYSKEASWQNLWKAHKASCLYQFEDIGYESEAAALLGKKPEQRTALKGFDEKGNALIVQSSKQSEVPLKKQECAHCKKEIPMSSGRKCRVCQDIYYCDESCQQDNWKLHRHTCKDTQTVLDKPFDARRCVPMDISLANDDSYWDFGDRDVLGKDNKQAESNRDIKCKVCGGSEGVKPCQICFINYCSTMCHKKFYKYHEYMSKS